MIYLITGYPRSGTTAAMQCMEAGGLPIAYEGTRDQELAGWFGPRESVYEFRRETMCDPMWPRQWDGHCIKVLGGLEQMARSKYRVVFMTREVKAIQCSYEKAFIYKPSLKEITITQGKFLNTLQRRDDIVDIQFMAYEDLLAHPQATLELLRWPIDAAKAATAVRVSMGATI